MERLTVLPMQPRRIARELALLCLSQLETLLANRGRVPKRFAEPAVTDRELQEILVIAVRFLREECDESLKQASVQLQQSHEQLLQSDIGARDVASAREKVQQAIQTTEQAINGLGGILDLPERVMLADHSEVRLFTLALIEAYRTHQEKVNRIIQASMVGWQLDRLGRIEQDLLRLSVTELIAFPEIPAKVSISEAVELAKRYGSDTTPPFINGVLRRVLDTLGPKS
ncbi:transcription antitermination factor NusB [Candidatus Cyanaurora vandensis]|uniref:transcription antitermination factor NusB n=1 Tax=Candidatus Cyanaurora vandensis TaxID=2714958 RepID=UPI00257D8360|nr:transcription antitermination factor NusB [Candidatus Cyanaurora vandensis]